MVSYDVPRLVVAAPASGTGKTTVATALMAALRSRGLAVSGHKVGPDYIDPGYHAFATGRHGRNLDPHLQGEHRVVPLFLHGAHTPTRADVAVVEGVMGLFDGAVGRDGFGSTAHVARLLDAPVLLVVDAASAGRSVAATVHGFTSFDPGVQIGGVILNRVGSDRHEGEVRAAVALTGVPVLGVLRRDSAIAVPERHLGLVPVAERRTEAHEVVDRLAVLAAASIDLDGVLALARSAPTLAARPWDPATELAGAGPVGATDLTDVEAAAVPTVALAGGRAFTFRYTETAELLAAAGCNVVEFDPAVDEALPDDTAALYLGGGFPEVHAADLAANEPMRRAIAEASGRVPVVAECAGLLYLCRELDGHPMAGVIDATAQMTGSLTLGYRSPRALEGSLLDDVGAELPAHEFHRTVVTPERGRRPAWRIGGDRLEGWVVPGRLHASYLHLHWAGTPQCARRLAVAARNAARRLAVHAAPAGVPVGG
jgi:cobyrinic acid a,c-diamide synthase